MSWDKSFKKKGFCCDDFHDHDFFDHDFDFCPHCGHSFKHKFDDRFICKCFKVDDRFFFKGKPVQVIRHHGKRRKGCC